MSLFDVAGISVFSILAVGMLIVSFLKSRYSYPVRTIAGYAHLRRAVQDAVEGARRIHLGLGHGALTQVEGAASLEALAFQAELAHQISVSDFPPTATSGDGTLAWMSAEVFSSVNHALDIEERTSVQSAYFSGGTPLATMAGVFPEITERMANAAVLGGHWGSEAAFLLDAAQPSNKIALAGSDDLGGQAVLFAGCGAALLGDEWFSSAAYLRQERSYAKQSRMLTDSLVLLDILRWTTALLILTGAIAHLAGLL